ncbi:MAG: hypothetical protein WBY53_08700 [Acidobacteriaceae bacterium]
MLPKLLILAALLTAATAHAQTGFGPINPTPPTTPIPQLLHHMAEQEAAFAAARDHYTFTQDVTIQTLAPATNLPDGTYHQISSITFDDAGRRVERVTFAPASTLQRVSLTAADLADIAHRLPFILTLPELPAYTLTYLGRQQVDQLPTYVFDCTPRQLLKDQRYFQGRVWLSQTDDQIVLIHGQAVPQDTRPNHENLSPPFTTYYQPIDGKYWFPVYTRGLGTLHFPAHADTLSQTVTIRTTVRYTNYKRFQATMTLHYGNAVQTPTPPQK